jgi:hypothetical protein
MGETFSIIETLDFGSGTVSFADKVKAATAYCLGIKPTWTPSEPNTFVWSCGGFRALCDIKCNAVMSRNPKNLPPRMTTEEVGFFSISLILDVCLFESELGVCSR